MLQMKNMTAKTIKKLLPIRNPHTHKGDYGKILLLCGSRGYTGAAALAAMGALRSGAGLVYMGVPESIYEIEAAKLIEPVILPLPDKDGMLSATAVDVLRPLLEKMDGILIGPGLGQSDDTFQVVRIILQNSSLPVVLDADGINLVAAHKYILRNRNAPTVLTPHEGEFSRIYGAVESDRVKSAASLARDTGTVVLLKGHRTVITDGTSCYINKTGNPGMATGGSGDVLAGIIVSLIGQGLSPLEAAAAGAWLHGASGDLCAREIGQYGMLPQDMVQFLPRLLY